MLAPTRPPLTAGAALPRAATRRRRIAHAAPGAPVWLFDLDNTLHAASREIFPEMFDLMAAYIAKSFDMPIDDAMKMLIDYTHRFGGALVGLSKHSGFNVADFLARTHALDNLLGKVHSERGLPRLVRAIPGRRILLTNAPYTYASTVLEHLGLAGLFERVVSIEHMRHRGEWLAKPDHGMLRRTLRLAGVEASEAVLVEDTRSHLKRYRKLGIRTVWITGHIAAKTVGRPHYVDHRVRSIRALARVRLGRVA
ncbi:HAD-IA family hydrolase [Paraburkholderia youngii]|uniref:HAD-IA family hydrolase n=1 Tax=Paraburkholderia youngii TaxID=2782701 RepID=UPI003D1B495F